MQYGISGANKIRVKETRDEATQGISVVQRKSGTWDITFVFSVQKRMLLLPYVTNLNSRLFINRVVKFTSVHRLN